MGLSRRLLLGAALAHPALLRAQGSAPIRIGEINSYSTQPGFTGPYRLGWQMAVAQINDLGGLNGRKLEVVSRDDAGRPENAVRAAGELIHDQKVDLLAGGYSSEVGLAISAYALQAKRLYVAGAPLTDALIWSQGNRYTYRVRPSAYMLAAMLVERAAALPAKTWVSVAPDDDYGRSAVAAFRRLLLAKRPDVRFVGEQWPSSGQLDAAAVVGALAEPAPDAIFNALVGPDLLGFVRQGNDRGLFAKRPVVSLLTGDPETLDLLGNDTPEGWIATGWPFSLTDDPSSKGFVSAYVDKYDQPPGMGSVIGAALMNAIASGILKSGGIDPEAMASGFADASFTTAFGICRFRAIDHQSTLGSYVGALTKQNGHGGMVDWQYVGGASVMPPDAVVRQLRPG